MTLVLKLDLDLVVTLLHVKNDVNGSKKSSEVVVGTYRHMDRQTCVKLLLTRSRGR